MSAPLQVDAVVVHPTKRIETRFAAAANQTVALVGPNGSGKTSVLRAIAGLRPLDEGQISVGAAIVDDPTQRIFVAPNERRIGLVFQDHRLFPHLSAHDNVAFAARARGRTKQQADAEASEWLERLAVADLGKQRPATLSGGQSQRVALARALAADPLVLLLDEPFAAIDQQSKPQLRELLRTTLASFQGPSVLVSHDPADVSLLSDTVIHL
jgi:molybdate transport system ATP-binding protein